MTPLEHRYRRLLALYPRRHREHYEDEMVAVLLADTPEGHSHPGVAATADLVVGALRLRTADLAGYLSGGAGRRAATLAALVVAMIMTVRGVRHASSEVFELIHVPGYVPTWATHVETLVNVGWLLVLVPTLLGWRRLATGLAALLTLGLAAILVGQYVDSPTVAAYNASYLILGAVATVGLATGESGRILARRIGARRLMAIGAVCTPFMLWENRNLARVPGQFGAYYDFVSGSILGWSVFVALPVVAVVVVPAVMLRARVGTSVLLRSGILLAPALAVRVVDVTGLAGWNEANMRSRHDIYLGPVQWFALVVAPVLAFVLCTAALRALDRLARQARLGRAAEEQLRAEGG
ncbi:MAG: hypothetical protein WCA46_24275 [Actinocatenispora sp.]